MKEKWAQYQWPLISGIVVVGLLLNDAASADQLRAGVGRVDITNVQAGPVNDPLYVKALVLKTDTTTAAIVTVDAVALGEIGSIGSDYLAKVCRSRRNSTSRRHMS